MVEMSPIRRKISAFTYRYYAEVLIPEPERRQIDDWKIAERNAAAWMRYWGFTDARVTPAGADSGIDIRSRSAIGQVKFQGAPVGRAELQRLVGARMRGEHRLFFFTGSSYSAPALTYGDAMGIALFQYDPWGRMKAMNKPAAAVIASATRDRTAKQPSAAPHKSESFSKEKQTIPRGCGALSLAGCGSFLAIGAIIALVQSSEDRLINSVILVTGGFFLFLCYSMMKQGIRTPKAASRPSHASESNNQEKS